MPESETNPVSVEGAELGRYLFYDPILSADSTISCSSCHRQEYAFSDGGKRFSNGVNGTTTARNAPALFNLAWNKRLFWDGEAGSIEEQVLFPVRDHAEMNLSWTDAERRLNRSEFYKKRFLEVFGIRYIDSLSIAKAIGQFERTLISANSKLDQVARLENKLNEQEIRGMVVMNYQDLGDCLHCHVTEAHLMGTNYKFSNNGIENITRLEDYPDKGLGGITGNPKEMGLFKIPSLRNVAVTGPYMHDGRFGTLGQVIGFYSDSLHPSPNIDPKMTKVHEGGAHLSPGDQEAVIKFLHCLTDSAFITNPAFGNPFK